MRSHTLGILFGTLVLNAAACKPVSKSVAVTEGAGGMISEFSQHKAAVDNIGRFVQQIQKNVSWHIQHIIKNSTFRNFGATGQYGLTAQAEEASADLLAELENPYLAAIPVPETEEEIIALNQSDGGGFSNSFALESHSSSKPKSGPAAAMKGLHEYLLCNSPIYAVKAYAATDKIPVLGWLDHFKRFAINIPSKLQQGALFAAPWLKDPRSAVEFEGFAGLTLSGPDAGFAAMLKLGQLWSVALKQGVYGSIKYGMNESVVYHVSGLPIATLPNTYTGATWVGDKLSVDLYQNFIGAEVGVSLVFSLSKLAQIGDLNAWKNGRTCSKKH
jgi:hypothetical protein